MAPLVWHHPVVPCWSERTTRRLSAWPATHYDAISELCRESGGRLQSVSQKRPRRAGGRAGGADWTYGRRGFCTASVWVTRHSQLDSVCLSVCLHSLADDFVTAALSWHHDSRPSLALIPCMLAHEFSIRRIPPITLCLQWMHFGRNISKRLFTYKCIIVHAILFN